MKENKVKNTKVFFEEFKGSKMFAIFEVDENGEKTSQWPVVSFGKAKALEIDKHAQELQNFVIDEYAK